MFLFEQTLLEDKQGTLVTVPTPVTEAEMEEQFSQYMCESIRLQTAMVKADRKCTENYLVATTESDKEAIKAIFEGTVTDYIKKSKETIMKAVQTAINWIKEKVKMITTKLAEKVKVVTKKLKELDPGIIAAMDKVEVQSIFYKEENFVYNEEFIKLTKEIPVVRNSKDINELKEINSLLDDYISNRKWEDGDIGKDLEEITVPFGKVKSRFAHHCSLEGIKKYAQDVDNANKFFANINDAIKSINPDDGGFGPLRLASLSKIARITQHYTQSRLALHNRIIAYAIKGTLKAIALAPKQMVKKEATKESASLLDDMLTSL